MRDIKIRNYEVLEILNEYKDYIEEGYMSGEMDKTFRINSSNAKREEWLSDEYMHKVMAMGREHDGYPPSMRSYHGTMPSNGERDLGPFIDSKKAFDYREKASQVNMNMMTVLSAKRNALCAVYPPGGFIAWHNNANASGYNILFTWSQEGNGWFDYYDIEKKERVRVPDVKGWQCKMGYFGSYDQPDRLCYHAASTDCLRITIAYVFSESEYIWEEVLEDIESDY